MLSTEVRSARLSALRYRNGATAAARRAALVYRASRSGVSVSRGSMSGRSVVACKSAAKAEVQLVGDEMRFPIVAFVEGVRQPANSGGPELFLAEQFEPALASAIGMPIVFNHPQITDLEWGFTWYVSVTDPGPFDAGTGVFLGQVADARFEDGRMIIDASLSLSRISMAGDEARQMGQALMEGTQVEVSIGHFSNVLPIGGFWQGTPYFGVHTDVEFDHLAMLKIGDLGACNHEMGCGAPRT